MKNRTGEKHITNEGYGVEIIEYFGALNCTIQFEDGNIIINREYSSIVRGTIKNPYHKSVHGVGYFGNGRYSSKTHFKIYYTWNGMLERCYSEKLQKKRPTYIDCTVDTGWCNFQNFAKWFEENYKENQHLDKDILIKGNKIYSPDTCAFVPQQINYLFVKCNSKRGKYPIGVFKRGNRFKVQMNINSIQVHLGLFNTPEEAFQTYKTAKEKYIKEVANKYKDQITEQTYQALINYQVEITD